MPFWGEDYATQDAATNQDADVVIAPVRAVKCPTLLGATCPCYIVGSQNPRWLYMMRLQQEIRENQDTT